MNASPYSIVALWEPCGHAPVRGVPQTQEPPTSTWKFLPKITPDTQFIPIYYLKISKSPATSKRCPTPTQTSAAEAKSVFELLGHATYAKGT